MEIRSGGSPGTGPTSTAKVALPPELEALQRLSADSGSRRFEATIQDIRPAPPGNAGRWLVQVTIPGMDRPLTLSLDAASLPSGLRPGVVQMLELIPNRGLKLLGPISGAQSDPLSRAVTGTLRQWMPLQGIPQQALSQLLTLSQSQPLQKDFVELLTQFARLALPLPDLTRNPDSLKSSLLQNNGSLSRLLLDTLTAQASKATLVNTPPVNALLPETAGNKSNPELNARQQLLNLVRQALGLPDKAIPAATEVPSRATAPAPGNVSPTPPPSLPAKGLLQSGQTPVQATGATTAVGTAGEPGLPAGSRPALALLGLLMLQSTDDASEPLSAGRIWQSAGQLFAADEGLPNPLLFPSTSPPSRRDTRTPGSPMDALLKAFFQILARSQVNAANGLQQSVAATADASAPTVWLTDLPVRSSTLDNIQLRVEKDNTSQEAEKDTRRRTQWRVVLAFDFEEVGAFQTRLTFQSGSVSAVLWADRPDTLKRIHSTLPTLRQGLRQWGIEVGDLHVRQGNPPVPENPIQRQMIDERA